MKKTSLHNMFKFTDLTDPNALIKPRILPAYKKPSYFDGQICREIIHVPSHRRQGKMISAYDRICGRRHSLAEHQREIDGVHPMSQDGKEGQQNLEENQNENHEGQTQQNDSQRKENDETKDDKITLKESVSSRYAAPQDTIAIKQALAALGYYSPDPSIGITEFPDSALFEAIKAFQKDMGLYPSGAIMPDSPTLDLINSQIQALAGNVSNAVWRMSPIVKDAAKKVELLTSGNYNGIQISDFKNDQELMDTYYEIAKQPTHEGYVTHPYVDTTGNVTYSVGINAGESKKFEKVDLLIKDANGQWREAGEPEKRAEYQRLMKIYNKNPNTKAEGYKGNFKIDETKAKETVYKKIAESLAILRSDQKLGKRFDRLHPEGKLAVLDMIYNMGPGDKQDDNRDPNVPKTSDRGPKGLTYKFWPKFFDAIERSDFATAAEQSHRKGLSPARNKWTHDMLIKGVKSF